MTKKLPKIAESEWRVMRVLWDRGPSTVRQVHEELGDTVAEPTPLVLRPHAHRHHHAEVQGVDRTAPTEQEAPDRARHDRQHDVVEGAPGPGADLAQGIEGDAQPGESPVRADLDRAGG